MSKFPTAVNLHKTSNTLGLTYGPDEAYQLPANSYGYIRLPPKSRATANRSCNSASSTCA